MVWQIVLKVATVRRLQMMSSVNSPLPMEYGIYTLHPIVHQRMDDLPERAVQSFTEATKRMQPAPLQLYLTRWLANYRLTPHSTTNRSPAEMLLRRRTKSRFDLIRPKTGARVEEKQLKQQMQHDQHAKDRRIDLGWCVTSRLDQHGYLAKVSNA